MDKQYEKRLYRLQNPRSRKRNTKAKPKFVQCDSHVGALIEEIKTQWHDCDSKGTSGIGKCIADTVYTPVGSMMEAGFSPVGTAGMFAIAAIQDAAEAVKEQINAKDRRRALEKRRQYYATDAARRAAMREQLKKVAVAPTNPCPTPEILLSAYRRRREDDECKIRFGTLMIDLEEHVHRTLQIDGNKFVGSSGGVKDWLKKNCPLLATHYSICQHYKRIAQEYYST